MSRLAAVFQIGSLGDSIVSVPTLLSLREKLPDCSEYLLVSRNDTKAKVVPADIFAMAWKPRRVLNYTNPERRLATLLSAPMLLAKLRYYRPTYGVYLMPSDREPERVERDIKFFKAGGVKELLGFRTMAPARAYPAFPIDVADSEAYRKFERVWADEARAKFQQYARVPVMQPTSAAMQRVSEWLGENRRFPRKQLIAMAPYSNHSSRDMPEQTLVNCIRGLTNEAEAEVVIVGGWKDAERSDRVLTNAGAGISACGIFDVNQSAALFRASQLALCTESGPMHLAAAVGTPLLAIFSRITKRLAQWLPFSHRFTALYREVPCAGCEALVCPVAGHPCMELISAGQIVSSAIRVLKGLALDESTLDGTKVFTWNRA